MITVNPTDAAAKSAMPWSTCSLRAATRPAHAGATSCPCTAFESRTNACQFLASSSARCTPFATRASSCAGSTPGAGSRLDLTWSSRSSASDWLVASPPIQSASCARKEAIGGQAPASASNAGSRSAMADNSAVIATRRSSMACIGPAAVYPRARSKCRVATSWRSSPRACAIRTRLAWPSGRRGCRFQRLQDRATGLLHHGCSLSGGELAHARRKEEGMGDRGAARSDGHFLDAHQHHIEEIAWRAGQGQGDEAQGVAGEQERVAARTLFDEGEIDANRYPQCRCTEQEFRHIGACGHDDQARGAACGGAGKAVERARRHRARDTAHRLAADEHCERSPTGVQEVPGARDPDRSQRRSRRVGGIDEAALVQYIHVVVPWAGSLGSDGRAINEARAKGLFTFTKERRRRPRVKHLTLVRPVPGARAPSASTRR